MMPYFTRSNQTAFKDKPTIVLPQSVRTLARSAFRSMMHRREASSSDMVIAANERRFFWPAPAPRPADHLGIPDVK